MAILLTLAMMVVIIVALILPVFGKHIGVFLFSQFQLSDEFVYNLECIKVLGQFCDYFCDFYRPVLVGTE